MAKSEFRFQYTIRVRWSECDPQGIAFNASYLNFLEVATVEYYRNLGVLMYDEELRKRFDTATVKATMEYRSPARIDDLIDVYLKISRIGNASVTMDSEIYRAGSEELLFNAEVIYVNYDSDLAVSRPVPDALRKIIETFENTGEIPAL